MGIVREKDLRQWRAFSAITSAAHRAGLEPFIMSGSALGYARCGRPIAGDKDIDLGFFAERYGRAGRARLLGELLALGARYVHGWAATAGVGVQDTVELHGVPVDLHGCPQDPDTGERMHFAYVPPDDEHLDDPWQMAEYRFAPFGLEYGIFLGCGVAVPDPLAQYLGEHFGADYLTPRKEWHWAHDAPNCRLLPVYVRRETAPHG